MTVPEFPVVESSERRLTLPDLPGEYLDITLTDNSEIKIEEIIESYPLAITDVTTEKIIDSKKLTCGPNVKDVYLIELTNSFASYRPGDTIGIVTKNRTEDVQRLFEHLGIEHLSEKKCTITEKSPPKKTQIKHPFLNKVTTLNYIFTHCLDLECIPKKSLIRVLSEFTKDLKEKRELEELCSNENSDLYLKNVLEANKTFLDFLLSYPSCCPPVARIIENLPKLLPRPYSIASSPLASPDRVRVVFSVVEKENREGLCTGMLKSMIEGNNEEKRVKMFFRKCNGFNLPDENVPLIFVGPGTGIAPFIGFLEHRKMQETKGIIWLFFGCRSQSSDYLFKDQLQKYLEDGILTKLAVAFSRDCDTQAKYVQDNIRKYGKEISELVFDQNARIFVCGDAKNMRKDIQKSFVDVFENHRGMTSTEAGDYIKKLQKEKRYLQDIWL